MIPLTVKERVLLHLLDYSKYAEAVEVPPEMTQEGVAQAAGFDHPHFAQYARPLVREGFVRERMAHIRGARKRRKAYDITETGRMHGIRLREKMKAEVVRVRDSDGAREATVAQVLEEVHGKIALLAILREAETGTVDLTALAARHAAAFVEMLADAPRLYAFVGRRSELASVTADADGPRLFIVRGVAGIGKSSFAAKVCELLRGKRNLFWHRVRPWDTLQSIQAALGDFLAALGKPGLKSVLVRGEASRVAEALLRDLPGTSSFSVFDDAHEASQEVLPFFRQLKDAVASAADVRVLVLTRRALPFYDRRDVAVSRLVYEMDLVGLEPQETAALLSTERDAARLMTLSRQLRGHPLFLDLVRANPAAPSRALRDLRRFIEEEIYAKLTGPERKVMKTVSLYRVPVPREALLPDAGLSYDVLLSLTDRGLIRAVGEEGFEVHDTVREFFLSVSTEPERRRLGQFAIRQLRRFASLAEQSGNLVASINCLSNALRLSTPGEGKDALEEALGNSYERIGDLPGALTAYKEAMKETNDRIVLARLHRRAASVLQGRGELASASKEIEEAFGALGNSPEVERGWLDWVKCRIATKLGEWEEAKEHAEAALRTFLGFGVPLGQAQALMELGNIDLHSPGGDESAAEQHYAEALKLAPAITDAKVIADLHTALYHLHCFHLGDIEAAATHVAAIETFPGAMDNLLIRRSLFIMKGELSLHFRADFSTAAADFAEATAVARKIHDPWTVAYAKEHSAWMPYYQGRIEEAGRQFAQVAAEFTALGFVADAISPMFKAAECHLLLGDVEAFQRTVAALGDPKLSQGVETHVAWVQVLRGMDRFIRGDEEAAHRAFAEALRIDKMPYIPYSHLFYSIVLGALGREPEATEHFNRAWEVYVACDRKPMLAIVNEMRWKLGEVLGHAYQASKRAEGIAARKLS